MRKWGHELLCVALGALSMAALFDARKLHGNYSTPAYGLSSVPLPELAFYLWYAVWGGLASVLFAAALLPRASARFVSAFERLCSNPRETVVGAALFAFAYALSFRHLFLFDDAITDDEPVYQLTARNLTAGHFTVAPPIDPDFLRNQFVVIDALRWHGKYPVGHSLLLAPFELLGRPDLLAPLIAALSVALTYAVARRFASERQALLAALLLVCSPHFIWTHATLLSQTSSGLTMLLGTFALLRHSETNQRRYLALLGLSAGFGAIVRPMPGLLVVAVLVAAHVHARWSPPSIASTIRQLGRDATWALPPMAACIGLLLLANFYQSGSPWSTGYTEVHKGYGLFRNIDGELTNSLGGALVRENVWLFGWPCSLIFVPFAVRLRRRALFWALIATTLVYRAVVPKTVVSTTGPIYVTEVVPFLCIGSAVGIAQVARLLERLGLEHPRERVAAWVTASFVVACVGFAGVELPSIYIASMRRTDVLAQLRERNVKRALVFGHELVVPEEARTWAYYAPNPWPDLRDEILYLRIPDGSDGVTRATELWRSRFADRPALIYVPRLNAPGQLLPLEAKAAVNANAAL